MAADSLCVGDNVCLYSEEAFGFLYGFQSSTIHSELAINHGQDREKPSLPDPQVISFTVCVANRYKLDKKYRKLKAKTDVSPDDFSLKTQASQALVAAEAENEDNVSEQTRQLGKRVLYGQVIQLQHVFTGKYIHISTTQTSRTESSNMQVDLCGFNAKQAQFRIMPRYKVKAEGDIVQVDDQIVLESVKSPGQYLHVSKQLFGSNSVYHNSHELNLSVQQSGFTIYRRCKPEKKPNTVIKSIKDSDMMSLFGNQNYNEPIRAGTPVRLFHKEIEAYLTAEGLFDDQITEDVHLRVRPINQNNPKSLFPSTSAITYWQIEMQEGPISGDALRWEQQCRFCHMTTRQYLIFKDGKVTLTDKHDDPKTVFRLHPVIKPRGEEEEKDKIEFETYCRIEHVVTGTWLHALEEEYTRKQLVTNVDNDMSMAGLQWDKAVLRQIGVSKEMQYDDAFTLQKIEEEHVEIFNYMAGMVPFIQKLIKDKRDQQDISAKTTYEVITALSEMKEYLIVNSVPNKERQKLIRNLRIVELLVQLLRFIPLKGSKDYHHLTNILVECYDVLYTYLMGDSRKNELYIAKHIDFFLSQIAYDGEIGLNAAHMVMELVKDNRKIVDRITNEYIDNFVQLLRKNKNYRYLDLLSVLCVCDGVSIPDNQEYIVKAWLIKEPRNCVYHTELGQAIGKEKNVVYLSRDNRRVWHPLHEFVQERKLDKDQEFLFLDRQLDLFGKLCYGRNEFAINVITKELQYLTWEEAFFCLKNDQLPDSLRATYCHLIIGLFVDVGENSSVLDRINLTFIYDRVGINMTSVSSEEDAAMREKSLTSVVFPELSHWISVFLEHNKDMTESLIGHNMLVEQVIRLVHYLVRYGYYGNLQDIIKLMGPLLSLLDGRNDKPFPRIQAVNQNEIKDVFERYRVSGRFKKGPGTKAIVDAKYQAMEVLDLFFNFRFNTRLERFVAEFKHIFNEAYHVQNGKTDLAALLHENYDIYESPSVNAAALKKLESMFAESAYFDNYDLTDILLDLSHYGYEKMTLQSMYLMDRFYSSYDNLFKRAVQAQVLITERSQQVLTELRQMLPTMQRLVSAKMTQEQTKTMSNILTKLIQICSLEQEPDEEHPMNQNILYNHGILATIFDILSQEIDINLMELEQYSGTREIFNLSFQLLEAMARNNAVVQQRLFDRLDMLLAIEGAEASMAEALTEVFTGNKNTCMKILPYQILKIMQLVAQHLHKAPQFMDLLNAIVKVEELNLPLKRNQGYVMKYFMQYRAEIAYVIDNDEYRSKLLKSKDVNHLNYMVALVDLLATCSEGENRFIESICQTIFDVNELLEVINMSDLDNNTKRPFLRFFLWVYLNTAGGMIDVGAGDLPHDQRMWDYFKLLTSDVDKLTVYVQQHPETVKQLLKKAPGKTIRTEIAIPIDDPEKLNEFLSEVDSGDRDAMHGSLHYLFEAALPFVQVFFRSYYQPDAENHPQEADYVDKLANALVSFADALCPLISNPMHMKTAVGCLNVLLSASTVPVNVIQQFQDRYGNGKNTDIRSDARKKYDDYYNAEEDLNQKLNIFAINFSTAYGGFNDVQTQIGFPSNREYTVIGGDEELPLGQEFQSHLQCFVDKSKRGKQKYHLCGKLVQALAISANQTQMNEKERLQQESLDIKCLQMLRATIHNEIIKLPEDWENFSNEHKKTLNRIAEVQEALNSHNAMLKVLPHLSKNGDQIIREVLAFLAAMLLGGNESVQNSLIDYFLGTREENFFFAIKNRMQLSAITTKEKRSLMAQHQAKIEEAIEQAKALKKALSTGKMAAEEIMMANNGGAVGSMLFGSKANLGSKLSVSKKTNRSSALKNRYGSKTYLNSSRTSLNKSLNGGNLLLARMNTEIEMKNLKNKGNKEDQLALLPNLSKNSANKVGPVDNPAIQVEDMDEDELRSLAEAALSSEKAAMDYKDEGYLELVLKVLGQMCDGQNQILQDYLREQPDNIKSVNLVAETARFLSLTYSTINNDTINLVTELFNTLVEFTSGNMQNQGVIFDNKICDYVNFILRGSMFLGCSEKDVLVLKRAIANLVGALTEENVKKVKDNTNLQKSVGVSKTGTGKSGNLVLDVMESLDADSIYAVIIDSYKKANVLSDKTQRDLKDQYYDLGFRYYHVLRRMIDLIEEVTVKKLVKTSEEQKIWDFFDSGTLSIEILKDDQLHKLYFRCKDKGVLRNDVKEKFKYEVDRSSPSNKLRDFMEWSRDIMKDIKYTRRVLDNPISRFFVKYWWWFNILMILLSFAFFLLIMLTWRAPLAQDPKTKNWTNLTWMDNIRPRYAYPHVDIVTYILGGVHNVLAFCVLISYFLTNHPSFPKAPCGHLAKKIKAGLDDDDDEEEKEKGSYLEVKFFSFSTFWYILLFAMSVLGTIFWGYFFSFHLLHMANFNQLLLRAIRAITKNGKSLLWVFVYGIFVLYIYGLIVFAFYRFMYTEAWGYYCRRFYQCMLTTVRRGLIDGLFNDEFLVVPDGKPFSFHIHKAVFDISFFILITTIGLNIIFGIIVDTFSELRDNKWQVDNDMHSTCFICSRQSYDFEHHGGGFEYHVKQEHNQWGYLFFFIHLDETRENDFTALELYVSRKLAVENYSFFPMNRALSLQHEEDDNEMRLETLMTQVSYLVKKMKEEEATKEREIDRKRQMEWEQMHKDKRGRSAIGPRGPRTEELD